MRQGSSTGSRTMVQRHGIARDLTVCGLFTALTAVGAFIKIVIPVGADTMNFTLQWFFVLLAGLLLGSRRAFLSVSTYLLDPTLPYCDVETTTYSYDPDKAMELLESAGWVDSDGDGVREKDGVTLSVTLDYITNQGTLDDAALVIAQELGEVGFDVTLRGADNMTWFTQVFTDFDFSLHSTYGGYYDPFLTMSNMNPEMM